MSIIRNDATVVRIQANIVQGSGLARVAAVLIDARSGSTGSTLVSAFFFSLSAASILLS